MTFNSKNPYTFITKDNLQIILDEIVDNYAWKICASFGNTKPKDNEGNEWGDYLSGLKKVVVSKNDLELDNSDDALEIEGVPEEIKEENQHRDEEEKESDKGIIPGKEEKDNENNIDLNQYRWLDEVKSSTDTKQNLEIGNHKNNNNEDFTHLSKEDLQYSNHMFIISNSQTPQPIDIITELPQISLSNTLLKENNINNNNNQSTINMNILNTYESPENEEQQKEKHFPRTNEFLSEECGICNNNLRNWKIVCCLCNNLILCQVCEQKHPHPTVQYKSPFLSDLAQTYNFLKTKHEINTMTASRFFSDIFSKEFDITIEPMIYKEIAMRPNKIIKVPLMIMNKSKSEINFAALDWVVTHFKHVSITYDEAINSIIQPKTSFSLNLICISDGKECKEEISVELISSNIKLKDNKQTKCQLLIEVNEDEEEEDLNIYFSAYEQIVMLPKKYKRMILHVMKEGLSTKGPLEIYEILKESNWRIDDAVDKLID